MAVLDKITSQDAIALENQYGAHNYHPLPVVLSKGEGVYVWVLKGISIMTSFLLIRPLIKDIAILQSSERLQIGSNINPYISRLL